HLIVFEQAANFEFFNGLLNSDGAASAKKRGGSSRFPRPGDYIPQGLPMQKQTLWADPENFVPGKVDICGRRPYI
ncbi:MAG: hypothetical protein ACLFOY_16915, partial [Desulfatibacillaceae bacterium]